MSDTNSIITSSDYNNKYNFKQNLWSGPCSKHTKWCFEQKYKSPHYGHLYNKETFECCHRHLLNLFRNISVASEKFDFKFFLDFGTLLGCLRNGKKIPYDADIDLGMCIDEFNNFKKAFDYLQCNGEVIKQINNNIFIYKLSKINDVHIDIFIYEKKIIGNQYLYVGDQYKKTPNSYFTEEDLFPLKKTSFENIETFIPNNSKKYIEANYGIKCIENPITKHSYVSNYITAGTHGDLPDAKTWNNLL
jgi:phosphorylcholine metabolism protein LicD